MDVLAKLNGVEFYNKWFDLMNQTAFRKDYYKQLEHVIEHDQSNLLPFLKTLYPLGTFWKSDAMNEMSLKAVFEFKDDDFHKTLIYLLFFPTDYIKKIIVGFNVYMLIEELQEQKTSFTVNDILVIYMYHVEPSVKLSREFIIDFMDKLHNDNYTDKTYKEVLGFINNVCLYNKVDTYALKMEYLEEREIDRAEDYFANNYEYFVDL